MEIKKWLSSVGIRAEEGRSLKPLPFPYVVFFDDYNVRGADLKNFIREHSVMLELYSENISVETEKKLEALLDTEAFEYKKNRIWINSERMYETIYEFDYIEKIN